VLYGERRLGGEPELVRHVVEQRVELISLVGEGRSEGALQLFSKPTGAVEEARLEPEAPPLRMIDERRGEGSGGGNLEHLS
jgi:hypothetical protein